MKAALLVSLFMALASSVATANDVRRSDTGGFSIYADDGEYIGRVVPNDTGGYDVRTLDGRKVDSMDSTGDSDADLDLLGELAGDDAEDATD